MLIISKLGILILVCVVILGSNAQERCIVLPTYSEGRCIVLSQCKPLFDLLTRSVNSPKTIETLKNSACGIESGTPKVCCPIQFQESSPTTITRGPENKPEVKIVDKVLHFVPGAPDVTNHPRLRLLDNNGCGRLTQPKIVGGNRTELLEFPWMALIAYTFRNPRLTTTGFVCGGSLINKRYVLTAAHCVVGLEPGREVSGVRLGEHHQGTEIDCDGTLCVEKYQNYFFESISVHEQYRTKTLDHDIALIRLDRDADLKVSNVKPICLPIGDAATLRQQTVIVTGWGAVEQGYRSQELLKVKLGIVPNEECDKTYRRSSAAITITYKQICAGGKNGMDSCGGDSGGPLQSPELVNGQPKYVQYGIVSFGTGICGREGYPGVYTSVVYYMDWILDHMKE